MLKNRLIKQSVLFLTSVVCLVWISGCATFNTATNRSEFIFVSTSHEVSMGRDMHAQLAHQYRVDTTSEQAKRLNRIGQKVARVSDRQDYAYEFYLIHADEMNAFTIPGGKIYFFSGLLDKMPDDNAVAAVLAHEIGHCAAKHTVKKFQAAISYNTLGNILNVFLSPETKASTAASISSWGANQIMGLAMSAYGRQDEYEADKLGIKYLILSGYDPQGMISVFNVLQSVDSGSKTPLILRSHPYVKDRIERVKKEIPQAREKY